jgi:hypothetical protein
VWKKIDADGYRNAVDVAAKKKGKRNDDDGHAAAKAEVLEHWHGDQHPVVGDVLQTSLAELPDSSHELLELKRALDLRIETSKGLSLMQRRDVQRTVQKNLFTRYGKQQESSALRLASDMLNQHFVKPTATLRKEVGMTKLGTPVVLVGRPDGVSLDGSHVIEIKNRIFGLMSPADGDIMQLTSYLWLVDSAPERGSLFQVHRPGPADRADVSIDRVDRDEEAFARVVDKLCAFAELVDMLRTDEALAQTFLSEPREGSAIARQLIHN